MEIVVCIKQVPDIDDIKWTKENNLDRTQMLSKINPDDDFALNHAMKIKARYKEANVTVVSMGPYQAKSILEYALAKGADRAILLSDKLFSGSDTLATSKILASAIKKFVPDFSLILAGQKAIDGDTEQVPVSIAQILNIIDVVNVIEIYNADKNYAIVSQKLDSTINMIELNTPCLIAVKKDAEVQKSIKINDYIKAQDIGVEIYGTQDIELSKEDIGIIGSPTVVYKVNRPKIDRNTKEIKEDIEKFILDTCIRY